FRAVGGGGSRVSRDCGGGCYRDPEGCRGRRVSGEWGPLTGPRCGSQGVPDGPLPAGLFGAGEGRRRRCHLSPRRGGGRPGWGPAVLRLLRTRPPHPAGRCDITPRKATPTRGRPLGAPCRGPWPSPLWRPAPPPPWGSGGGGRSALGAAYGTAKSGTGIAAMSVMRPEMIMKSIIPVVMAGIIAIYGLVVAVLIANSLNDGISLYRSFLQLGAGLSVGLSGLAAGFAIGIVGDAGVRGTAQQPRLFVGMILILIFAEVLGLYGLIVALILSTK
uniref:Uncharacterized protein n=1 Tax=Ovis aries TaxID=9940 RepID=A0AC11EIL8_SHEEP